MRKSVVLLLFCVMFLLTSCSLYDSLSGGSKASNSAFDGLAMNSVDSEGYYNTGGDYSSTHIAGDKVDYSYDFRASGNTNKSKQDMLSDYEDIQTFVNDNGGYIDNVNNDYHYYDSESKYEYSDEDKMNLKSRGVISFDAEIDNVYVPELLDKLETLCKDNKFTVTDYTQNIVNYKGVSIREGDSYSYDTITRDELNRRIKYATVSVRISYCNPRNFFAKAWLHIKHDFAGLFEFLWAIIQFGFVFAVFILITLMPISIGYKSFKKMVYKFRLKHPEYYDFERKVVVRNVDSDDEDID